MNDDIRQLPNGDFEVVYKPISPLAKTLSVKNIRDELMDKIFDYPKNCPKCIKPDFTYQMPCVCPPNDKIDAADMSWETAKLIDVSVVASQKGIHYINYKNQFVIHKQSKEIYYVKSERDFDSNPESSPICYCITLKNYLVGYKVNTPQYDVIFKKNELELVSYDGLYVHLKMIQDTIRSQITLAKIMIYDKGNKE